MDSLTHQKALLLLDSAEVVKSIFEDEHRALDLVNRSLVLDSTIVRGYLQKSELLRLNGQIPTALQMLDALKDKSVYIHSDSLLWEHANVLYHAGQKEAAEQKWREAMAVTETRFAAQPSAALLGDLVKLLRLSDGKQVASAYLDKRLAELIALKVKGKMADYSQMSRTLSVSVEELLTRISPIAPQHYDPAQPLPPRPPKGMTPTGKDPEIDFVCDFYLTEVLGWLIKRKLPQKCTPELAKRLSYINFRNEKHYTSMRFRRYPRERWKDDSRVLSVKRLAKHRFEVKYMDNGLPGCTIVETTVTPNGFKMKAIVKADKSWEGRILLMD